ncbi:MAG: helix-turn-helix transcriptional regulator [Firmicutes bacterium]|nr:helix-turn-helix transcriptional regulator [Bacillota bacterium]
MSNKVGKRIKGLRRLKGFTQQELAEKIDISVTMLSHIERGLRKPEPRILELIVAVLEVPSEELFFLPDGETK